MWSVYKHTSPSGKVYIGITGQEPKVRWQCGNGYRECPHFQPAIAKYGWNNFKHEILFTNLTKAEAEQKEIELIAFYKSNQREFGYNTANGGNASGTHSEETKKLIGLKSKGRIPSEEARRKRSESMKGKHFTEEHKRKIGIANKGKNSGRKASEEARRKMSIAGKGRPKSEEMKRKNSLAQMGGKNHKARAVIQYDLDNNEIARYEAVTEASRSTGASHSNIIRCCLGQMKKANGYIWRYADV